MVDRLVTAYALIGLIALFLLILGVQLIAARRREHKRRRGNYD